MKIYFTGSDVQLLNEFPKQLSVLKLPYVLAYRKCMKEALRFAEEIWVVHDHLIPELNKFGITEKIKVFSHPLLHNESYGRKLHEGFNVLYYWHKSISDLEWNKWIYGYDVFLEVKEYFKDNADMQFIECERFDQYDMKKIYPITDFYLRCNQHDGDARMVQECKIQEIPYYWSWENPDVNGIIEEINRIYHAKT